MNRTEAIKILRETHDKALFSVRTALETLIPELKESEDERIRKALLRCCDDWDKGRFGCMAKEDVPAIRAYLEKQKEQKPNVEYVYPKFRVGDEIVEVSPNGSCPPVIIKYIGEGNYNCESKDRKRFLSFPIKQENEYKLIEQKPAEWGDSVAKEMFIKALERAVEQTKKGYELTDCDKHSWWEDFKAYCGIAPAEWREKDKEMLGKVLECIRFADDHYQLEQEETNGVSVKSWLLDHIIPQPKQEWSEEDDIMLNDIIRCLPSRSST